MRLPLRPILILLAALAVLGGYASRPSSQSESASVPEEARTLSAHTAPSQSVQKRLVPEASPRPTPQPTSAGVPSGLPSTVRRPPVRERDVRQTAVAVATTASAVAPIANSTTARPTGAIGNGVLARVIPDGNDDDVVVKRLRRAAQQERDPHLRDQLWKEYVEYKKNVLMQ
jgi:hypothetical protein